MNELMASSAEIRTNELTQRTESIMDDKLLGDKESCTICGEIFTEKENTAPTLSYTLHSFFGGYMCLVHLECEHFIHSITHCNKDFFEQAPKTRDTALSIINKARETRWKNTTQQKTIDYLRRFIAFICDKTLVVLVNGEEYTFNAIGNETALELKQHILYESHNTLRSKEHWDLFRQDGRKIDDIQVLKELNVPRSEKLILSLKFAGGDTFFISTPYPAHLDKNGDFISKKVWDEALKEYQQKKNLFVNEYSCVPVIRNDYQVQYYDWNFSDAIVSQPADLHFLSNEDIRDSYMKARKADNIVSISAKDESHFTSNHKVLTSEGFKKISEIIDVPRSYQQDDCSCDICGNENERLIKAQQDAFVLSFSEDSIVRKLSLIDSRLCSDCWTLASSYKDAHSINDVIHDLQDSFLLKEKIIEYYSHYPNPPTNTLIARKAFHQARIDGLETDDIVIELDVGIEAHKKQKEEMIDKDIQYVKQCQDCGIKIPKFEIYLKCKICNAETNSKHLQYCDECRSLKQFLSAKYMRFDETFLDKELKASLKYSINHPITPRYDARRYFLEHEYSCCVCSSEKDVVVYNEKYPLCVDCAALYECCSKTWTNERAVQELKKSLVFAKSENHEASITFEDRRMWLDKQTKDDYFECTKERKDPISLYSDFDNPDACVICGMACDKKKKIIDTTHGFKIALHIHDNHLKFIDVDCGITPHTEVLTEWQNDVAAAQEIIMHAVDKFKKEYDEWLKQQGNSEKEVIGQQKRFTVKKSTNEIKLLGTGDLQ